MTQMRAMVSLFTATNKEMVIDAEYEFLQENGDNNPLILLKQLVQDKLREIITIEHVTRERFEKITLATGQLGADTPEHVYIFEGNILQLARYTGELQEMKEAKEVADLLTDFLTKLGALTKKRGYYGALDELSEEGDEPVGRVEGGTLKA